ncbi:FAD/FMN-containing dehydrogenase [Sclerotinia borealis F-4128]|uniref:FAD/FMN-containing dehydrogenase n=1 Tax=Sclerotinia borealis (strain F-4128) TaxID=1432307 RepID=W9CXD0_SCLBF|nr:FAD/FMN-containing dehydrogenase [Sclerotinia borealis F-4128]
MASILQLLPELEATLTPTCEILTDPTNNKFVEYLKRWTDIDLEVPGAIVLPSSEGDCQKIVQWAFRHSVPFVTKSGGHSQWSTIGSNGIIIDLSLYKGVEVDATSNTAILKGSVLSKEVAVTLAKAGFFTALGNGNTVGAIPYFLGGGASITSSITGFGSDQILSASIITAKGELYNVTSDTYPDLLYAIRGAGQFFGLITQLVIKIHPLQTLGNDEGVIWAGSFVFPLDRAREVTSVMKDLMENDRYATAGLMMIMAPPPKRLPCLVIAARYTGDPNDASAAYKVLYDLQPIIVNGAAVPIQNASDGREALGAKGGFKRFGVVGLHRFDQEAFLKNIDLWTEMVAECPDAINTAFNFQWDARPVKQPDHESAMCLHDIRYWQNNLIWHTDSKNRSKVDEYNDRCIAVVRGEDEVNFADFQNGTRIGPIERRYRGEERLARLKALKKEWDPTGVFTTQLLE